MYDNIGKNISILHRHNVRRFALAAEDYRINSGEFGPLIFIYEHPGHSQKEISTRFAITKGTVAKMIQRFEQSGFIERRTNNEDKRADCIYPTKVMEELYPKLLTIRAQSNGLMIECLTEVERTSFDMLLSKVAQHVLERDNASVSNPINEQQ